MNGAALDTLENSIGGTNPVQGSISPQNLDLVLVNNLPSTSSLSKVVSLSFEMLGWGGGGVTNCHSFLLSNPTLSLSSPLKTMLDDAANGLILNWIFFCSLKTKADICLGLWKVVAEYIDDMSNGKNGINDDINVDEADDYAYVCLEHRSQGGGGALMSSCPDLPKTCQPTKTSRQQPNYTFASPCQSGKPWWIRLLLSTSDYALAQHKKILLVP